MIDPARALPILRAAQSPDDTAPIAPFAEGDAVVARSFNESLVISYLVEDAQAVSYVRWRDVASDIDRLHDRALANLRALAKTHLRLVPRDRFSDVVLDGKVDASLLLLDELWDGTGLVARAVASPIVAAAPSSDALLVATAGSTEGVAELRSRTPTLLVRRTGTWDRYA